MFLIIITSNDVGAMGATADGDGGFDVGDSEEVRIRRDR